MRIPATEFITFMAFRETSRDGISCRAWGGVGLQPPPAGEAGGALLPSFGLPQPPPVPVGVAGLWEHGYGACSCLCSRCCGTAPTHAKGGCVRAGHCTEPLCTAPGAPRVPPPGLPVLQPLAGFGAHLLLTCTVSCRTEQL